MLPGSSAERIDREAARGTPSGRTQEIQRLIGRSLRAVIDMARARRASGHRRLRRPPGRRRHPHRVDLRRVRRPARRPEPAVQAGARSRRIRSPSACAAVSVGIVDGVAALDLRLRRGRPRRGRHERGDDVGGPLRRGAGHGRGHAVHAAASSTSCSAWPRAGSARSSTLQAELLADRRLARP